MVIMREYEVAIIREYIVVIIREYSDYHTGHTVVIIRGIWWLSYVLVILRRVTGKCGLLRTLGCLWFNLNLSLIHI